MLCTRRGAGFPTQPLLLPSRGRGSCHAPFAGQRLGPEGPALARPQSLNPAVRFQSQCPWPPGWTHETQKGPQSCLGWGEGCPGLEHASWALKWASTTAWGGGRADAMVAGSLQSQGAGVVETPVESVMKARPSGSGVRGRVRRARYVSRGKGLFGKNPELVCSENARSQAEDWTILLSGSSGAPKETAADAARSASPRAQPSFSEAHPPLITPTPQSSLSALCPSPLNGNRPPGSAGI